jgi:hypothetical protein
VRNSIARVRRAFCSTDGPAYDSAHTSSHLNLRILPISYVIRGCLSECLGGITFVEVRLLHCKNSQYDPFRFRFYSSVCICLTPMRSRQDMTITVLGCTPEIKATPASFQVILARNDGALNVRCILRMRFCAPTSPLLRHLSLYWVILC